MSNEPDQASPFSVKGIYDRYKKTQPGHKNPHQVTQSDTSLPKNQETATSPSNPNSSLLGSDYRIPAIPEHKKTRTMSAPIIPKTSNQDDLLFGTFYDKVMESQLKQQKSAEKQKPVEKPKMVSEKPDTFSPESCNEREIEPFENTRPESFHSSSTVRPEEDYFNVPVRQNLPDYPTSLIPSTTKHIPLPELQQPSKPNQHSHRKSSGYAQVPQTFFQPVPQMAPFAATQPITPPYGTVPPLHHSQVFGVVETLPQQHYPVVQPVFQQKNYLEMQPLAQQHYQTIQSAPQQHYPAMQQPPQLYPFAEEQETPQPQHFAFAPPTPQEFEEPALEFQVNVAPTAVPETSPAVTQPDTGTQLYTQWLGAKQKINEWVFSTTTSITPAANTQPVNTMYPSKVITAQEAARLSSNPNLHHQVQKGSSAALIPGTPSVFSFAPQYDNSDTYEPCPSAYNNNFGFEDSGSGNSIRVPIANTPLRKIQPSLYDAQGSVNDDIIDRSVVGTPFQYGVLRAAKGQTSAAAMASAMQSKPHAVAKTASNSADISTPPPKFKWKQLFKSSPNAYTRNSKPLSRSDILGPPSIVPQKPANPAPKQASTETDQASSTGSSNPTLTYRGNPAARSSSSLPSTSLSSNDSSTFCVSDPNTLDSAPESSPDSKPSSPFDAIQEQLATFLPLVTFIRYISNASIILMPLDKLADAVPALLPAVVFVEFLLLLSFVYQLSRVIESAMHVVQILSAPAIAVAKLIGIGARAPATGAAAAQSFQRAPGVAPMDGFRQARYNNYETVNRGGFW